MSQINVFQGNWDETCTTQSNLTQNQAKMPVIRDIIQYAEPRMLSTLIVSGAKTPWDLKEGRLPKDGGLKTKIGAIPKDKLIGDNAYRYNIQGRIQQKSFINAQVGTSGTDGSFQLSMMDSYLVPGMVAMFYDGNLQARVMSKPSGAPNAWVYSFQTMDGSVFSYANSIAIQPGQPTCMGSYTAYGEKSLRGYGRGHFPSQFINHLSIQRKTISLSGDALTSVLWYEYLGEKGWMFAKEREARLQFMIEDEVGKWKSVSTMKDSNGNLLSTSRMIDPETGEPIVQGDGVEQQLKGVNEAFSSGSDGNAVADDFIDMMTALEVKSDSIYGKTWYVVTGTQGYGVAQKVLRDYHVTNLGGRIVTENTNSGQPGGQDIFVGGNFDTFDVNGNRLIFCKHPKFDDEQLFPQRGSDGLLIQSSKYYFLDMDTQNGNKNIEIMGRGAYGINRIMVSKYLTGMTGEDGEVVSSVDAKDFNMLKQDGIFIYNTASCGMLNKSF